MYYTNKDKEKFANWTKLISRGAIGSSSHKYGLGQVLDIFDKENINSGTYDYNDIVGISVNGSRRDRISFDKNEVLRAIKADATIITDNEFNRNRQFNIGERELAEFLIKHNYGFHNHQKGGVWKPLTKKDNQC